MDGNIFTLIFLVLAVVVILKLRSVLGRRTEEDDARVERLKAEQRAREAQRQAAQDKVVALPRRDRPEPVSASPVHAPTTTEDQEARVRSFAGGDPALGDALVAIYRADHSFDPEAFMKGARAAYEMIVTAFAEGNRKVLRPLLSREVYEGFQAVIAERESRGELIEHGFVGINKSEMIEAEMKRNMAHVTVKFVSDLISATRDKAGNVLAGDPNKIKEVIDIWTFARDVESNDPNWKLVATQAPN